MRKATGRPSGPSQPKPRRTLAPSRFATITEDRRLQKVVWELRKLRLDKFSNAGIGLFRMLLEMGSILYQQRHGLPRNQQQKLAHALGQVLKHLTEGKKVEEFEAKPVRVLINGDKDRPWSLDAIQSSMHNPRYSLTPEEMMQHWDELEPFLSAMCDGIKK